MFQELELQVAVMWVLASARVSELLTTEPSLQPKFANFKVYSILSHGLPEEAWSKRAHREAGSWACLLTSCQHRQDGSFSSVLVCKAKNSGSLLVL